MFSQIYLSSLLAFFRFRYVKDVKPEHKRAFSITDSFTGSGHAKTSLQLNALHDAHRLSNMANNKA
jgi:hypothetical protein